jgi:ribosomal protein L37AE/L43A/transposase-like protein
LEAELAKNKVQFQKGLSEEAFRARYGTEEQCRAELFSWRWPSGFICPACHGTSYVEITGRKLYQCSQCRHQASLIAGTIFHSTKLPLTTWFAAMYHLTQGKKAISSIELGRRLGVSQTTAWKLQHKLMQVMLERDHDQPLTGERVEVDDAYLGGERSDGTTGRGTSGKTPFVAAVQTTVEGQPVRVKFSRVAGFTRADIKRWAQQHLSPGSTVYSDGLSCFLGIKDVGCRHQPMVTGSGKQAVQNPTFKWVNTLLGNLKNSLVGTYHAIREKHVPRYLAQFQYRFNRRYRLGDMIPRLAWVALRTPPMPYRLLTLAEVYW